MIWHSRGHEAAQVWGGCGTTYQLRPLAELEPGVRYELSSARVENTPERSSFVVGEADTTPEVMSRVDVTATLEDLPPDLVGAAICGDAKLGARPITTAPGGSSPSALAWLAVAMLARQCTRRRRAACR